MSVTRVPSNGALGGRFLKLYATNKKLNEVIDALNDLLDGSITSVDLTLTGDLVVGDDATITGDLSAARVITGAGTVSAPGLVVGANDNGQYEVSATQQGFSIGNTLVGGYNASGLFADVISEQTSTLGVTVDGVLNKDGGITSTIPNIYSNATGITAFAGGGQASATALTKETNNVTTVASAGDSVKLPTAVAGLMIVVKNNGIAALAVFPFSGDAINGGAANASVTLAPEATSIFRAIDADNWEATLATAIAPSAYDMGTASQFVVLAGDDLTDTAPQYFPTGDVGYITSETGDQTFGTGSLRTGAPVVTAVASVASLKATLIALPGTDITAAAASIETFNAGYGAGVFVPGVYTTASAIGMTASTTITLLGDGDYVFISTGGAITFGASDNIVLANGARASRVFWVASTDLSTTGANSSLKGNFLTRDITVASTNIIEGRLLASRDVTIDGTATGIYLPLA